MGDNPILQLNYRKRELVKKADKIIEKAELEKRELTNEEQTEFDNFLSEIDEINLKINKLVNEQHIIKLEPDAFNSFPNIQTGEKRFYLPGERLYDERSFNLPDGIKPNELSLGRWIRGIVTGDWKGAEAEKRAMSVGDAVAGGWLVPEPLSIRVIDLARNQTRVIQAGAITIPMTSSTLPLAKISQDIEAYWKRENDTSIFTDVNFEKFELRAKTLVGGCLLSEEVIQDAENIDKIVEDSLSASLALKLDLMALRGTGAEEEPLGIRNTSGINTIDKGSAALTNYDEMSQAYQKILEANAPEKGVSVIMPPYVYGVLDRFKDANNQPLTPPPSWQVMNKYVTNQIPTNLGSGGNETEVYIGNFGQVFIGVRKDITIEVGMVNDSFKKLQVAIRGYLRADIILVRPSWFTVIHGILVG